MRAAKDKRYRQGDLFSYSEQANFDYQLQSEAPEDSFPPRGDARNFYDYERDRDNLRARIEALREAIVLQRDRKAILELEAARAAEVSAQ